MLLNIIEEMRHSNGFERPMVYIQEVRPRFLAAGQALLDEAAAELRQRGVPVETVLLESKGDRVSELIAKQAEASQCDLVVLGTHGRRGVDRLLLGSDAEQLARIAPVPVMLVRQPTRKFVQPSDIGEMAVFLCRDAAANITGTNISMDGGWTAE